MKTKPWALRGGAYGRFYSAMALSVLGGLLMILSLPRLATDPMLLGAALSVGVAACFLLLGIRCSACGLRLVWHAMRTSSANGWAASVLGWERCPRCGAAD